VRMKKYNIKIKGNSPLVFNTPQQELQEEISKLKKDEYSDWEKKNWKRRALRDKSGNVIIPIIWIKAAFENACKHCKMVPNFATSKKETYTRYAGSMYFNNSTFKCSDKELISLSQFMGAQGKNSSSKVLKIYPKVDKWETNFEIADPEGRMTTEELKTILEYAGMFEGIGDFRKVNCGRFEVDSIKEIK
jgi:hypothetical protein